MLRYRVDIRLAAYFDRIMSQSDPWRHLKLVVFSVIIQQDMKLSRLDLVADLSDPMDKRLFVFEVRLPQVNFFALNE